MVPQIPLHRRCAPVSLPREGAWKRKRKRRCWVNLPGKGPMGEFLIEVNLPRKGPMGEFVRVLLRMRLLLELAVLAKLKGALAWPGHQLLKALSTVVSASQTLKTCAFRGTLQAPNRSESQSRDVAPDGQLAKLLGATLL